MVGSVALLSAELHTAQRQHASLHYLLACAEARLDSSASADSSNEEEVQGLRDRLREFGAASAQQLRELRELDATLARQRDRASSPLFDAEPEEQGCSGSEPSVATGSAAIRLARRSRAVALRLQASLQEVEAQRDELSDRLEAAAVPTVVGAGLLFVAHRTC